MDGRLKLNEFADGRGAMLGVVQFCELSGFIQLARSDESKGLNPRTIRHMDALGIGLAIEHALLGRDGFSAPSQVLLGFVEGTPRLEWALDQAYSGEGLTREVVSLLLPLGIADEHPGRCSVGSREGG